MASLRPDPSLLLAIGLLLVPAASATAAEGLHDALADVFRDEAGHWEGTCVARGADGFEEIEAVFDITWDDAHGHAFVGRYGETPVRGHSELRDGLRIDIVEGAPAPSRARIESVRHDGPEDYRYVVHDPEAAGGTRQAITRLGARQIMIATAADEPGRPLRVCSYRRTGPPATR